MVQFIADHRAVFGVEPICAVLPIAPSTYHRHRALLRKSKLAPGAPTRRFVTDRSRTTLVDQARSFD